MHGRPCVCPACDFLKLVENEAYDSSSESSSSSSLSSSSSYNEEEKTESIDYIWEFK